VLTRAEIWLLRAKLWLLKHAIAALRWLRAQLQRFAR